MAERVKIKFWQGLESARSGITPDQGVPIWVTDTKSLYVGDGATAGGNLVGPAVRHEIHTWAVGGEIKVPSGDTDFIVPFFILKKSAETVTLLRARHRINAGTSVTAKLQKNDVDVTGWTGISVTTTNTTTDGTDTTFADGDKCALVVTAVAGTPQNMTFTLEFERKG